MEEGSPREIPPHVRRLGAVGWVEGRVRLRTLVVSTGENGVLLGGGESVRDETRGWTADPERHSEKEGPEEGRGEGRVRPGRSTFL